MRLLSSAAWAAVAIPLGYSLWEPWQIIVRQYAVHLPGLPPEIDGLRIAQLSDIHCSAITPPSLVRKAVALCNAQQPDVIVLTGDYISRRSSYLLPTGAQLWAAPTSRYTEASIRELAELRASEGCFAVPGNHDYSEDQIDLIHASLGQVGIDMITNKAKLLRGVLPLIGLDDLRSGRPDWRPLHDLEASAPHLILSHNPRLIMRMANRNCFMLSGHVHGGQVNLPLTQFRRRPRDVRGTSWLSGWYHWGSALLYISDGVGSVHFPMRFRCPPEIAIFSMRAQPSRSTVRPN